MKTPVNSTLNMSSNLPLKKQIFLVALISLIEYPCVLFAGVSYTSTPQYDGEPYATGKIISVPFTCNLDLMGEGYEATATYGALVDTTMLRFYTSDPYHVYGPYGSSDSWGNPVSFTTYAGLTLSNPGDTLGGSVKLLTGAPVTSVDYDELARAISGYDNEITYGALTAGTEMRIYTSDAYHVYCSSSAWSLPVDHGTYSSLILQNDTSGGNVSVNTTTAVTSVTVPEPTSIIAFIGFGLTMLKKRT